LLGAIISFGMFTFIRRSILEAEDPRWALQRISHYLVGLVFCILILSVIYKGLQNLRLDLPIWQALAIALVGGGLLGMVGDRILQTYLVGSSSGTAYVEQVFRYLQVLTAAYMAFAHGANDVANAIGPLAVVVAGVQGALQSLKVPVPLWLLALGGVGIVLGVMTFGYRVILTVGKNITEITASRGFSAEFSCATTVLLFSKLGLPISTTHTIVGAVIGVGLARGMSALNLRIVWTIWKSWLATIPFTAAVTMVVDLLLRLVF
jgi:PiT family inorganic phosphate transporter